MVRVTYGAPRAQKKQRLFKQARGYRGGRSKLWRTVQEALVLSLIHISEPTRPY